MVLFVDRSLNFARRKGMFQRDLILSKRLLRFLLRSFDVVFRNTHTHEQGNPVFLTSYERRRVMSM